MNSPFLLVVEDLFVGRDLFRVDRDRRAFDGFSIRVGDEALDPGLSTGEDHVGEGQGKNEGKKRQCISEDAYNASSARKHAGSAYSLFGVVST